MSVTGYNINIETEEEAMHEVREKLEKLEKQHSELKESLSDNTAATSRIEEQQKEILQFFNDFKTALRFLGYIAVLCKWVATVGAGIAASVGLYHLVKSGTIPPMPK